MFTRCKTWGLRGGEELVYTAIPAGVFKRCCAGGDGRRAYTLQYLGKCSHTTIPRRMFTCCNTKGSIHTPRYQGECSHAAVPREVFTHGNTRVSAHAIQNSGECPHTSSQPAPGEGEFSHTSALGNTCVRSVK